MVEELAAHPPSKVNQRTEILSTHEADVLRPANAAADHAATVGSRLDPARLHLVGVRSHIDELLAALDSALVPKKLLLGLIVALLLGMLFLLERAAWFERDSHWLATAWSMLAVCSVICDGLTGLLTRLTYVELARLRPARWRHGLDGLWRVTIWIIVSKLIVWGYAGGMIVLLRWLPYWLGPSSDGPLSEGQQILGGTILFLCILGEVLLYPVFAFWWLLPPLLVVENCTVWSGLQQWIDLLRQHLGRVLLYQSMAVGLGVLLTAPFLLLVAPLFFPSFYPPEGLEGVLSNTRLLLLWLACTPLLTYWLTSNVFIYLNLRYGATSKR